MLVCTRSFTIPGEPPFVAGRSRVHEEHPAAQSHRRFFELLRDADGKPARSTERIAAFEAGMPGVRMRPEDVDKEREAIDAATAKAARNTATVTELQARRRPGYLPPAA